LDGGAKLTSHPCAFIDGGDGDDELECREGDDVLSGGTGTGSCDGGDGLDGPTGCETMRAIQ
jgi:hypothetical protein